MEVTAPLLSASNSRPVVSSYPSHIPEGQPIRVVVAPSRRGKAAPYSRVLVAPAAGAPSPSRSYRTAFNWSSVVISISPSSSLS